MRPRHDHFHLLSDRAARGLARDLDRAEVREDAVVWSRYLDLLRAEGFDDDQMAVATGRDRRDRRRRLFGVFGSGLAAAAVVASLAFGLTSSPRSPSPAPEAEISATYEFEAECRPDPIPMP